MKSSSERRPRKVSEAGPPGAARAERWTCFATCANGLEPLLHEELRALKASKVERQVGGVRFDATLAEVWRANLELRTATRVLVRLGQFSARDAEELYRGAAGLPFEERWEKGSDLWVSARTKESELDHTRFIEQRVKDAVCDRLRERAGARPDVNKDNPGLRLDVHVYRDRVTLSMDSSGEPLFKRGWRVHQGRAPLAETLAAGCVLLSGWDRRAPLVDPFCGSGTVLIEAALLALGIAPGSFGRSYGFERWKKAAPGEFAKLRQKVEQARGKAGKLRLMGFDHHPERVAQARENVTAAGLDGMITIEQRAFADLELKRGWNAWIVSNAPYGQRVGDREGVLAVHRELGRRLREEWAGSHLALLVGSRELGDALGLDTKRLALSNGGLETELVCYRSQ